MAKTEKRSVIIETLTPWRAKLRDIIATISVISGFPLGLYAGYMNQHSIIGWIYNKTNWDIHLGVAWLATLVIFMAMIFLAYSLLGQALARRIEVEFTEDGIEFRRWIRVKSFDRTLPLRFVLRKHDRANAERDRHTYLQEKARLKGKARNPRKYYQRSYTLSLEHIGEPHDIISIYGERKAMRDLARLNAMMAQLDGAARSGRGVAISPQDEWHDAAGGLPNSSRS
ncbi:MAG: hypothetical protein Hals2KO_14890 [Halioglobus sp.]